MKSFPQTYNSEQHIYYCFEKLSFYKNFIENFETLIENEQIEYKKFLNNRGFSYELGQKYGFERNKYSELLTEFPNMLRQSTFISLWSYFENSLNVLCEVFEFQLSLSINYSEMKGRGIDRSKLYLTKIIKLDFPTSDNWNLIKKLQRIRNKIVHSYSKINNDNSQLLSDINYFKYLKLVPLNSKSVIHIEKFFLEEIIEIFANFYRELLESIRKV